MRFILVLFSIVFIMSGCLWKNSEKDSISSIGEIFSSGKVALKVEFLDNEKKVQKAPPGTVNIVVKLSGLNTNAVFPAADGGAFIDEVPTGTHTIDLYAINATSQFTHYGTQSVSVEAGKTAIANIIAESIAADVKINNEDPNSASTSVTLSIHGHGATQMMISNFFDFTGAVWESYSETKSWTLEDGAAGLREVYVKFKSGSNHDTSSVSDSINYTGGVAIPGDVLVVDESAAGPVYDGTSWTTAYKTLQDALFDTNLIGNGGSNTYTKIWVAEGDYYPDEGYCQVDNDRASTFELVESVEIYGGFLPGDLAVEDADPVSNVTTLSGDLDGDASFAGNAYHVVSATDGQTDATTMLKGFNIVAGAADGGFPNDRGAGLFLTDFDYPIIDSCIISDCMTSNYGAAVYCSYTYTEFTACEFNNNSALDDGGAVHLANDGGVEFYECKFTGNSSDGSGGAMYIYDSVHAILEGCIFDGNSVSGSNNGGGISVGSMNDSDFTSVVFKNNNAFNGGGAYFSRFDGIIDNCEFKDNEASNGGGGLYLGALSEGLIKASRFISNDAFGGTDKGGGGIYCYNSKIPIERCLFEGNRALNEYDGGAISIERGTFNIENTVFSLNQAQGMGGAIHVYDNATISIVNCTIANNSTNIDGGGGLSAFVGCTINIINVIFWGNTAPTGNDIECGASSINVDHAVLAYGFQGAPGWVNRTTPSNTNTGFIQTGDPEFYDGYRLGAGSSALNNGTSVDTLGVPIPVVDIEGNPRPGGSNNDMGAYEQ